MGKVKEFLQKDADQQNPVLLGFFVLALVGIAVSGVVIVDRLVEILTGVDLLF